MYRSPDTKPEKAAQQESSNSWVAGQGSNSGLVPNPVFLLLSATPAEMVLPAGGWVDFGELHGSRTQPVRG